MIGDELKEYLKHRKDGFFEFEEKAKISSSVKFNVDKLQLPSGKVGFIKEIYGAGNGESDCMVCAEVLLSRLYQKLGLKSIEYYPVINNGHRCVISESYEGENISLGSDFFDKVMSNTADFGLLCLNERIIKFCDEYNRSDLNTIQNFLRFADVDFFRQLFIVRGLDVGTFNYDRNFKNFFVESDASGIAKNMILLDNEASGCMVYKRNGYHNDFTSQKLFEDDLIRAFKQNEDYQQYITRFEIAETIATAPFEETAHEIKEEMGFVVEHEFLETMKANSNNIAEELVK